MSDRALAPSSTGRIAVLGAGLAGSLTALKLARTGFDVILIDAAADAMRGASLHNEGKLHLGYVYGADQSGETYARMIEGSLSFIRIVEELTGHSIPPAAWSRPFIYGVMADSRLHTTAIEDHLARVDAAIAAYPGAPADWPGGFAPARRLNSAELASRFNPDCVTAAFQTNEVSVDTRSLANAVRNAIKTCPRITPLWNTRVQSARGGKHDTYILSLDHPDGCRDLGADFVINALWQNRLQIDASAGLPPAAAQLMRYKLAITLNLPPGQIDTIPTATFVSGPYGDVVNHGDGRFYLSWYPACKLAETQDLDTGSLEHIIAATDRSARYRETLAALGEIIPGLACAADKATDIDIAGGFIMARGSSDITDANSELHQRYRIGPRSVGNWISVDTGKYCTAPSAALAAANMLLDVL
ncbi:FAD-dependent oxidoreductase [Maricaulis sp.]|uniref:FAD-dependent oxidoreductase n=1 Tax=Maricaulis sp. TaxID=1486257 RepID=UPI00263A1328|nr:FAD-dependent oxidoreductase [Maricaulis sp.]